MKIELTQKQYDAMHALTSDEYSNVREVLFGGAMGGGKTFLGCVWLITQALKYPNTRWLMGRARLKDIQDSTLVEFTSIVEKWGLAEQIKITFNNIAHKIEFKNGSLIEMKPLAYMPNDPEVNRLKGTYTGCFIDEGSDVNDKVYIRILTRLRWMTREYGITGKILTCSNPSQGFLKKRFYDMHMNNEMPKDRLFIPSTMGDNKHLDTNYVEGLNVESIGAKEFNYQVLGDWNFTEDMALLFDPEKLKEAFYVDTDSSSTYYLTCDPAGGLDRDYTVVALWLGGKCQEIWKNNDWKLYQTEQFIKDKMREYSISPSRVAIDAPGVGLDLAQRIRGCIQFFPTSSPFNKEPYKNKKSQLWYKFSKMVNEGEVVFQDDRYMDEIIEDLSSHKRTSYGRDQKMTVTSKENIKQEIGRSPDLGDCLVLRAAFEYGRSGFVIQRLK
tara:strand:+ start:3685 stop:5007 length:1323 start_codon:yes stop_codon:yes gene_type:complete